MNKTKIIGLVLSCTGSSYGMNLQAYATQYIIEKLGYETEIIKFKSGSSLKGLRPDFGLLVFLPRFVFGRFFTKKADNSVLCDDIHINNDQSRVEVAKQFRTKRLHNFTKELTFDELQLYCKKYDAVLIGSDQGWLPGFAFGRRNSLRFVPEGIPRLSYATSLGVSSYPWYCRRSSRLVWKEFSHISVREEEGRSIITQICGDDFPVEVVVDPTYLITTKEWDVLIPFEKQEEDEYVLSFILGNDVEQQKSVRRFANSKRLKLVSILSNESTSPIDLIYPDRVIVGAPPEQFINLIRGAKYVFTDSFHGIAFSIINRKQLFVFYRRRLGEGKKDSRNSRIDNILRLWGISEQLIADPSIIDWSAETFKVIDFDQVHRIIERERVRSLDYLRKALP